MQHDKLNPFDRPQHTVALGACVRRVLERIATACALAFVCGTALAAPGDLDPTFGVGGKVLHSGFGTPNAAAFAVDAGGNVYTAGTFSTVIVNPSSVRVASSTFIAKLDTNGNAVTTFKPGGQTSLGCCNGSAPHLALDVSGNIYAAGSVGNGNPFSSPDYHFAVFKLDANGNSVTNFGQGGNMSITIGNEGLDLAFALALDTGGNVYVAGCSDGNIAVVKLDTSGNLAPGFGVGGKQTISMGIGGASCANALVLDASDNLYVAGSAFGGISNNHFAVMKLDRNGNLVPSFAAGGIKIIDIDSNSDNIANALALDGSGNIYVAGTRGSTDWAVAKLDGKGNLVSSFGAGGKEIFSGGSAKAVALDASGNIYVAGGSYSSGNASMAVFRLDANGNLVSSFGAGGTAIIGPGTATALALDASGRILVAGTTASDVAIIRLQGDQPASTLTSPVFRFFNTSVGTHFYTISAAERDNVVSSYPQFHYEGPAFNAYTTQVNGSAPVYRFFNTATATHFYTINEAEKNNIVATLPTFHFEGPAYYAYPTQLAGTSAVYRLFNTANNTHFYTISAAERDNVMNAAPQYHYEGPAYYAVP